MNPQLFSQKMSENSNLLNLYQDYNNPVGQMSPFTNPAQMNFQAMMFKAQAMKLMQFRAMYMQNMMKAQEMNKMEFMKSNHFSKVEPQVERSPINPMNPVNQINQVNPMSQLKIERPPVNPMNPINSVKIERPSTNPTLPVKIERAPMNSIKLEKPVKIQYQDPTEANIVSLISPTPSNVLSATNAASSPSELAKQMSSFAAKGFSCDQINFDNYLKAELEKILRFILNNMGRNQKEIEEGRNLYSSNPTLLQVYDKLVMKYFSAKKCKEDIVRYILRKALKTMRATMMKKEKVNGRKASLMLCKRYFQSRFEELEKSGVNVENEDELLEFCMPYKKNSKNKTMNTSFVVEIFASDEFCQEYQLFLENLEGYLEEDNSKKMKKLIVFIMDCIKNNTISKLGSFNRLPWLGIWNTDTKNIAVSLMPEQRVPPVKKLHE